MKQPKCSLCRKIPTPNCDYKQGRCPHRPVIELTFIKLFDSCINNVFPKEYKNFGGDQGVFTYYYINNENDEIVLDRDTKLLTVIGVSLPFNNNLMSPSVVFKVT